MRDGYSMGDRCTVRFRETGSVKGIWSGVESETGAVPSAAHDLRAVEGEGVGLVRFRSHLVGLSENRVGEKLVLLKVEL